jgi:hypothetical protein
LSFLEAGDEDKELGLGGEIVTGEDTIVGNERNFDDIVGGKDEEGSNTDNGVGDVFLTCKYGVIEDVEV